MDSGNFQIVLEDIRAHFKAFGESLEMTNSNVTALRGDVHSLDAKVQSLDAKVQSLDAKVQSLDGKVCVLQTDMTDVKQRVTRIEGTLNGALPRARRKPKK